MQESTLQHVGILLCGGRGSRFDPSGKQDKLMQILPEGQTVAAASARHLRAVCARVVAVVRPGREALQQSLLQAGCEVLVCEDADLGMSATLRAGLLHTQEAPGWLVALADMPFVQPPTYQALLQAMQSGSAIVAPQFRGRRGNPVGFLRVHLPELLALRGDQGARSLLQGTGVTLVTVEDSGIQRDIDTPTDLP